MITLSEGIYSSDNIAGEHSQIHYPGLCSTSLIAPSAVSVAVARRGGSFMARARNQYIRITDIPLYCTKPVRPFVAVADAVTIWRKTYLALTPICESLLCIFQVGFKLPIRSFLVPTTSFGMRLTRYAPARIACCCRADMAVPLLRMLPASELFEESSPLKRGDGAKSRAVKVPDLRSE